MPSHLPQLLLPRIVKRVFDPLTPSPTHHKILLSSHHSLLTSFGAVGVVPLERTSQQNEKVGHGQKRQRAAPQQTLRTSSKSSHMHHPKAKALENRFRETGDWAFRRIPFSSVGTAACQCVSTDFLQVQTHRRERLLSLGGGRRRLFTSTYSLEP